MNRENLWLFERPYLAFPQLKVTVALLQTGAAENTGVSSPAPSQGLMISPGRAGLQYFLRPALTQMVDPLLQVHQIKKIDSQLPCLCLFVGGAVSMPEEANQEDHQLLTLYYTPLLKKGYNFQRIGPLSLPTALEQRCRSFGGEQLKRGSQLLECNKLNHRSGKSLTERTGERDSQEEGCIPQRLASKKTPAETGV